MDCMDEPIISERRVGERSVLAMCKGSDPRREHVRQLLQAPAWLHSPPDAAAAEAVRLIDIARAGVAFVAPRHLEAGSVCSLQFQLPGQQTLEQATALIVYSKAIGDGGQFRIGARFPSLAPATIDRLVDFLTAPIERALAARTGPDR